VNGSKPDYKMPKKNLNAAKVKRLLAFPLKNEHKLHPAAQRVSTLVLLNLSAAMPQKIPAME
jgi:hypothetical protein